MKVTNLRALVFDPKKDASTDLLHLLKRLFSQLKLIHEIVPLKNELSGEDPTIFFLNLSAESRSESFKALDTLTSMNDKKIFIFGFMEAYNPELVAHSLENGVSDLFFRPFDEDLIATKINRYFTFENTLLRSINFTELKKPLPATINIDAKLRSIDENGLTLTSLHYPSKGSVFQMRSDIVKQIFGKEFCKMMITKTWKEEDSELIHFYAEPQPFNEETSAALRSYILKNHE